MTISRRHFLHAGSMMMASLPHVSHAQTQARQHIVIVGAGFGGATVAKYLRYFNADFRLTLIEPGSDFVMCPMSMRVIHGGLGLKDISRPYAPFVQKHDIKWIKAKADGIDPVNKLVMIGKEALRYDKLILSPGVDFNYDGIPGLETEEAQFLVPHAWKAGPQTIYMRDKLRSLPRGGSIAIHIPKGAIRAKPAAYERASLLADFLKTNNPKAKVLVFDSGAEPPFAKDLVLSMWKKNYGSMIEYVPNAEISKIDANNQSITFKQQGQHKVDLLNVIPPQRSGAIARTTGVANVDKQWCGVNFINFESTAFKDIHVLGDSVAGVNGIPKSGQLANQSAKVCAAAITAQALNLPVNPSPVLINAAYSYSTITEALRVVSVYRYDEAKKTMAVVKDSSHTTEAANIENGLFGMTWATNILDDIMA